MKDFKINENIVAKQVRLVYPESGETQILTLQEALAIAESKSLDLVAVGVNEEPVTCKLMDYARFRFDSKKKQKDLKKKTSVQHLKELTVGPSIATHDYEVKLRKAREFLENGDRVKIVVKFRGRQILYKSAGEDLLNRFMKDLENISSLDGKMLSEGKNIFIFLKPSQKNKTH